MLMLSALVALFVRAVLTLYRSLPELNKHILRWAGKIKNALQTHSPFTIENVEILKEWMIVFRGDWYWKLPCLFAFLEIKQHENYQKVGMK